MKNKGVLKDRIPLLLILFVIAVGSVYYKHYFTPKNSIELHQELTFANSFENAQKLFLKGYEGNLTEEDFNAIKESSMYKISQFTVFEYYNKSYIIMTSPGRERLKILSVEELPEDIRRYFSEFAE